MLFWSRTCILLNIILVIVPIFTFFFDLTLLHPELHDFQKLRMLKFRTFYFKFLIFEHSLHFITIHLLTKCPFSAKIYVPLQKLQLSFVLVLHLMHKFSNHVCKYCEVATDHSPTAYSIFLGHQDTYTYLRTARV